MADLNNLFDDINQTIENEGTSRQTRPDNNNNDDDDIVDENQARNQLQQQQQQQHRNNDENLLYVPPALLEIESKRKKRRSYMTEDTEETSKTDGSNKNDLLLSMDKNDINSEYYGGMFGSTNEETMSIKATQMKHIPYTKLKHWWIQELNTPELVPNDDELITKCIQLLVQQEGTIDAYASSSNDDYDDENDHDAVTTGNEHMDALFASLLRVDMERMKFLLCDILKQRLNKIESYPIYYATNDTMRQRMSENEVRSIYHRSQGGKMTIQHIAATDYCFLLFCNLVGIFERIWNGYGISLSKDCIRSHTTKCMETFRRRLYD